MTNLASVFLTGQPLSKCDSPLSNCLICYHVTRRQKHRDCCGTSPLSTSPTMYSTARRMSGYTTENLKITKLDVKDIRFPTSLGAHGSDAMVNRPENAPIFSAQTAVT